MIRWKLYVSLAAVVLLSEGAVMAQQTPPVMPKTQEAPLPPAVVLPGPEKADADVSTRPITAAEAVAIALRRQPTITSAVSDVEAAKGRKSQAVSGLLPSASTTAGYTMARVIAGSGSTATSGTSSTGSSQGFQAALTIRQLVYDFHHTQDLVDQASSNVAVSRASLDRVRADVELQVKQAFYGLVQAERLVTVNETNLRNQQDHLALAQARLNAGFGVPIDVVRAQTSVADAVLSLTQSRTNATNSRVALALAIGVDPRAALRVADSEEPAVSSDDVGLMVRTAVEKRPEIARARATLEAAVSGLSAARSSNLPSLSASAGISGKDDALPPANDGWVVGASIQWAPFDSGLTAGKVKEAQAAVDSARAALMSTQLSVTSDVAQAYLNLRTAEQHVSTADAEESNASEGVRLAEGRYRSGVGAFIEVTDAQAALLTARTNRVNVLAAVSQARAALARAVGGPIPGAVKK